MWLPQSPSAGAAAIGRRGLLGAATGTAALGPAGRAVGQAVPPPAVAARAHAPAVARDPSSARVVEYWLQVDSFDHNAVADGADDMTGAKFRPNIPSPAQDLELFNGSAFLGNTADLHRTGRATGALAGDRAGQGVHVFHIHGHR
jgi:hypothetical protein